MLARRLRLDNAIPDTRIASLSLSFYRYKKKKKKIAEKQERSETRARSGLAVEVGPIYASRIGFIGTELIVGSLMYIGNNRPCRGN